MTDPKVLIFDIETAGVNALKADLGFVILFGWKWLGEKQTHCISIDESSLRKFSDKRLLKEASRLFEQADLIVAHYGSVFDRRFIQGRLLVNNLPPVPALKMVDTVFLARSVANFSSNRLGHLTKILGCEHQKWSVVKKSWPDDWFKVMQGDTKALRRLGEYCKADVQALEDVYLRLRPFSTKHTRIITDRSKCRLCGSRVQYRGTALVGSNRYRKYVCTDRSCGHWDREIKPCQ